MKKLESTLVFSDAKLKINKLEPKPCIKKVCDLMLYIALLIVLCIMELFYIKIAKKYNIVDIPNFRSSHSVETIKGGGILIPLSLVLLYFYLINTT